MEKKKFVLRVDEQSMKDVYKRQHLQRPISFINQEMYLQMMVHALVWMENQILNLKLK